MLVPFILLPGRQTAFPPAIQTGCVLHSFCLQADAAKLQAALDARFADPSHGAVRYEAIGSKLFISVAEIARIHSSDLEDSRHGWLSEIDVTIWVMARLADTLELRWIPLWLFVDNGPAMATGREVFGFPKEIGRFQFSPSSQPARRFEVRGLTIADYQPDAEAFWSTVIDLKPKLAAEPPGGGFLADLGAFAEHAAERLATVIGHAEAGLLSAAQAAIGGGGGVMAFLKQFPDAAQPHLACYQGIIEADAKVAGVRSIGFTDHAYTAEVTSYASHPFLSQLGLVAGPQDVGLGIVVDFDFSVGLGREIWRAPTA